MSETRSLSSYSDSTYSYSYSNSTEKGEDNEMWSQILRMPFSQLKDTENFSYIEKVMSLVNRYTFSEDDPHMMDSKYTMLVARLLKLITTKCGDQLKAKAAEISLGEKNRKALEENFNAKLSVQHKEIARLREFEEKALMSNAPEAKEDLTMLAELRRLREENDNLAIELRKLSRENEELRQFTQIRKNDREEVNEYNSKMLLEFKHLVAKHNRLLEKSKVTEDMLQELRAREETRCLSEESELARLREKVDSLQAENAKLVHSRDRAEELCEHREAQALRDMAELRQVTKKIIQAEAEKFEHLKVEFANFKAESDSHLEEIINQHEVEITEKEEEIKALQIQVGKTQRIFDDGSEVSSASASASVSEATKTAVATTSVQHRLQRENYDLSAEIEQLEIRLDAAHEENSRLARIVKDYESGNEGLRNLRHNLADANRTNELLQHENTQLRERLHAMEDSLTFTAALQELCRRIGVTEEEINSLKPTSTQTYSEMDTLKDELNILKEEVEWLEKDRRHWMNKVRLQPLMDTKLRFELGLTSDQLKQLDTLVEQMKAGKLVLEEDDTDYKEKYYKELQMRRKDAAQFNDYVKGRIDSALQHAIAGIQRGGGSFDALTSLRDHIQVITAPSGDGGDDAEAVKQLRNQLETFARRVDQSDLTIKSQAQEIGKLHEQITVSRAEKEVITKECERYRDLVFSYIANEGSSESNRVASEKWADIATALRDQVKLKDDLIETMIKKSNGLQQEIERLEGQEKQLKREITVLTRTHKNLNDQLAVLRESNDELVEHNAQLTKMNKDVVDGLEMERDDYKTSRELLQKIVVLRKREGVLIQRLRRATAEKEEILASEHNLRTSMDTTLQSLKNILQGTSNGFVLAPSATTVNAEQDVLGTMHEAVAFLTRGKLYREDSSYLAKLYNIYCSIESMEALAELRSKSQKQQEEIHQLTCKLDESVAEVAELKAQTTALTIPEIDSDSIEYYKAAASKWEAEATRWQQKFTLGARRLEVKEQEVALLEAELGTTREEVVKVKTHIQNLLSPPTIKTDTFQVNSTVSEVIPSSVESKQTKASEDGAEGKPEIAEAAKENVPHDAVVIHRLEKEVARLKSINFSLLQHSLDIQASTKTLEIELEGKKQELSLVRSASDGKVVGDFITAAIHEHTTLRRQSELALIQTKKLKMRLAATEANLQVVSNEATSYKLGAYRLYRKYVDEVVKVVDYLRSIQRSSEGALSPHRAEILDKRYARVLRELETAQQKNASLISKAADLGSIVKTLEQQLELVKEGMTDAAMEKLHNSLREAHSKARESGRQLAEAQEDAKHASAKVSRMEEYIKQLTEELSRLEFGCIGVSPLDETMLRNLLHLKETVFSATQAPPLALTVATPGARALPPQDKDGADTALLAEYKQCMAKQVELSKECSRLREELEQSTAKGSRHAGDIKELRETVQRLEETIAYKDRQLDEARRSAEVKETRMTRAHETQTLVANRAAEHTIRCLQDLLQKKDGCVQQLQSQLQAERQRLLEFQTQESARVEQLHDEMLRDNSVVVSRFQAAIHGAAEEQVEQPGGADATAVLTERIRALTAQVVSLKQEVTTTREMNISLEAQLQAMIQQSSTTASIVTNVPGRPAATPVPPPPSLSPAAAPEPSAPATTTATPSEPAAVAAPPPNASADALSGIIRNQQTILDSMRSREMALMQELSGERQRREAVERELERVRLEAVERGATITLPIVTGRSPVEDELRTQITRMEQALADTRQELEVARTVSEQQRQDAVKWQEHLNAATAETEKQREELNKARQMAAMSEDLQASLNGLRSQNEKLVLAASILKQRLMEEAQRGGTVDRKLREEVALAQRLGVIQEESARQVRQLDHKVKAMQRQLEEKVTQEHHGLQQDQELHQLVGQLQTQLREKEQQLEDLRRQMQDGAKKSTRSASRSPKRKLAPAPLESDTMAQPQIASLISKELHKMQRDNLQEISALRAAQRRSESDLEEARQQLRSERDTVRQLRSQVQQLKKEREEVEERLSKEVVRLRAEGVRRSPSRTAEARAPAAPSAVPEVPAAPPAAPPSHPTESSVEHFQQRIAELEVQLSKAKAAFPTSQTTTDTTLGPRAAPRDVNQYIASIQSLEKVIDELQKKVSVDATTKVNVLEYQISSQRRSIQQLATDLATAKNIPVQSVQDAYQLTAEFDVKPTGGTEKELLEKTNRLVEVEHECETLRQQVSRLQQHFQELLQARGLASNLVPASEVAVLSSLISNLNIVVESLRQENAALRGRVPSAAHYAQGMEELQRARQREGELQHRLQEASSMLVTGRTRSSAAHQADMLMSQRALSPHEVEHLFPALPPPLPQNPYRGRTPRVSTPAGRASAGRTGTSQKRLSSSQH